MTVNVPITQSNREPGLNDLMMAVVFNGDLPDVDVFSLAQIQTILGVSGGSVQVAAYQPTAGDQTLLEGITIGGVNYVIRDKVALDTANGNYTEIKENSEALNELKDGAGDTRATIESLQSLTVDIAEHDHEWETASSPAGIYPFAQSLSYAGATVQGWSYQLNWTGTWTQPHNVMARIPQGANPSDYRAVATLSDGSKQTFYLGHEGNAGYAVISEQGSIADSSYDYFLIGITHGLRGVVTIRLEYDTAQATTEFTGDLALESVYRALKSILKGGITFDDTTHTVEVG